MRLEEWDDFLLPYTSGTTGRPKGVRLSHRARVLTFFAMAVEYGCYSPDDRALAIAPLFHGGGFSFCVATIFFGGSCTLLPRFDPEETLRLLSQERLDERLHGADALQCDLRARRRRARAATRHATCAA